MKSQRSRKRLLKSLQLLPKRKRVTIWMVSFWHPQKSKSRGMWRRAVMTRVSLWRPRAAILAVEVAVAPVPFITLIIAILIIANTTIILLFVSINIPTIPS